MLVIRLQRTGRSGHAHFRVVVQDSRFSAKSGRVVEYLGSYDPHSKVATVDKEKTAKYLSSGAQPSDRVMGLLKNEGIKLPAWVTKEAKKKGALKHPEKLRRNRPAEAPVPEPTAETEPVPTETTPAEEAAPEAEPVAEGQAPETTAEPAEEVQEPTPEKTATPPAEESASEEPAKKDQTA
jgi:small subunit ribosomal protein S16